MKCPILAAGTVMIAGITQWIGDKSLDNCLMANCAWWEEHFGKCSIAVEAYLKGVADRRLEAKEALRDKY